jgi:hypothetical protein
VDFSKEPCKKSSRKSSSDQHVVGDAGKKESEREKLLGEKERSIFKKSLTSADIVRDVRVCEYTAKWTAVAHQVLGLLSTPLGSTTSAPTHSASLSLRWPRRAR